MLSSAHDRAARSGFVLLIEVHADAERNPRDRDGIPSQFTETVSVHGPVRWPPVPSTTRNGVAGPGLIVTV